MNLKAGDPVKCPACNEEWEGVVDDYVISGRVGIDSEATEQCVECEATIRVVKDPDGTFFVAEE